MKTRKSWRTMSFLKYYWFNKKKKKPDIHTEFIPDGYIRIKVGAHYSPRPLNPIGLTIIKSSAFCGVSSMVNKMVLHGD